MMPNIDFIPVLSERPVVLNDKNPVAPTGAAQPNFKDALQKAQGSGRNVDRQRGNEDLPKPEEARKSAETRPELSKRRTDADSDPDDEPIKKHEHAQKTDDHTIEALSAFSAPTIVLPLPDSESVPLEPLLYVSAAKNPDSSLPGESLTVPSEDSGVFAKTLVAPFPPAGAVSLSSDELKLVLNNAVSSYGMALVPPHAQNRGHVPSEKPSSEVGTTVDRAVITEELDSSMTSSPKPSEAMEDHALISHKSAEMEFNDRSGGADTNAGQGNLAERDRNKTSFDQGAGFKSPAPLETTVEQPADPFKTHSGFGNAMPDPPTDSGAASKFHVESAAHVVHSASLGEARSAAADSVNPAETTEVRSDNLSRAEQFDLVHEIVEKMKVMLRNGDTEVKISLKPEYLGELHVLATIRENAVTASILTQSPEVKEYLESHLSLLQTALQEQGLRIDKLEVTTSGNFSADLSGGNASSSNNGHPRPAPPNIPFSLDLPQSDPSPEPADVAALLEAPARRLDLTA